MQNLKPCPFCGHTGPRMRKVGNGYAVICGICGARGGRVTIKEWHDHKFITQGQAADFWNRREGAKYAT